MTLRPCIIIDLRAQRSESFICVACRRRGFFSVNGAMAH